MSEHAPGPPGLDYGADPPGVFEGWMAWVKDQDSGRKGILGFFPSESEALAACCEHLDRKAVEVQPAPAPPEDR